MEESPKATRGPSAKSKKAQAYLLKHPAATALELAKKFKISHTTVYRAPWWINRNKGEQPK